MKFVFMHTNKLNIYAISTKSYLDRQAIKNINSKYKQKLVIFHKVLTNPMISK